MTKYKAIIRLAEEPMKIIKWFTKNFDKEVGALGIGEMKDGELCVEKLVFPTQTVNGAHVHFKPEDWSPIVQELTTEELSKIIFYWHKHPGSASASQGDEEDTFDVFMDENSGREFFGFLQTAQKVNGGMEYEGRIEMRTPIWASITDVELATAENDEIEETCQQIIDSRITMGTASASDQPGFEKETLPAKTSHGGYDYSFGKDDGDAYFEVKMKNGCIKIESAIYFEEYILSMLDNPAVSTLYKNVHTTHGKDNKIMVTIHPKKKQMKSIYKFFKEFQEEIFVDEEKEIVKHIGDKLTGFEHYDEAKDIQDSQDRARQKDMHNYGRGWYGC